MKVHIVIALLVALLLTWGAMRQVWASSLVKCTGVVYLGHPALVNECRHQLFVRDLSPYPEPEEAAYPPPGEPLPYPPPETPLPEPTRIPMPRPMPTEPPEYVTP